MGREEGLPADSGTPRRYDPAEWAELCGFKYAVFTTKHHNGFCMFPTKTTDFSIERTPYRKDITKGYVDAFRSAGLENRGLKARAKTPPLGKTPGWAGRASRNDPEGAHRMA